MRPIAPAWLIAGMFTAQVLGMTTFVTFPGLLPIFQADWSLNNAEAGWVSGIFFAGFVGAAPILTALTDRIDPRRIYLFGMATSALANLAFAWSADGLWSGSVWRCLQGIGFAGTYMPGLRALSDAVPECLRDRAVAYFTATFTVGASFSFYITGLAADAMPWQTLFAVFAIGPVLGLLVAVAILPARSAAPPPISSLRGVAAQMRNGRLYAYFAAYFLHNAESSTMRAFVVGLLAFGLTQQPAAADSFWAPTTLAAIANLLGLPGIVLANEITRFMRRDVLIAIVMMTSALIGIALGAAAVWPYWTLVALLLAYGLLVPADVGAINAGVVQAAGADSRGAALALHSVCGFTGAFLGPVVFGGMLDVAGGQDVAAAWPAAFAALAALIALWPLVILLRWLIRR